MNDLDFDDIDDVMPLCSNCHFDGPNWSCTCTQRAEDIKNGVEKPKINGFCGYYKEQEWITNSRKKGKA